MTGTVVRGDSSVICCQSTTCGVLHDGIQGTGTWLLQVFELDDGSSVTVDPSRHTATFGPEGQLNLRVDCNVCNGSYEQNGSSLAVDELMACTLAACPPGSLERDYLAAIASAASFEGTASELGIRYEGGTLRFQAE